MNKLNRISNAILLFGILISSPLSAGVNDKFAKKDLCNSTITWGKDKIRYCRDQSIYKKDKKITRAVIFVHGTGSFAKRGYKEFMADRKSEGIDSKTTIVSPQFLSKTNSKRVGLKKQYQYWNKIDWAYGGNALNRDKDSSYSWMDYIVRSLIKSKPNLKHIVVSGFSGGGQFVNRYSAFTKIVNTSKKSGVSISFVVGSPSTYLYLTEERPGKNCKTCNNYIHGLDKRSGYSYLKNVKKSTATNNVLSRSISYVVGSDDIKGWTRVADMAQGKNRLDRFHRYNSHVYWTCETLHPGQCPFNWPFYVSKGSEHDLTVFDQSDIRRVIYHR